MPLFSLELDSFVSLIIYFLLFSITYVFCLPYDWVVFVNTWQKGGEISEMWEICFKRFLIVLFLVDEIVFERGRIWKAFDVSNLGGELAYFCFYIVLHFFLYVFLSTHILMCSFECFRKDMYILIRIFYLFLQLLG